MAGRFPRRPLFGGLGGLWGWFVWLGWWLVGGACCPRGVAGGGVGAAGRVWLAGVCGGGAAGCLCWGRGFWGMGVCLVGVVFRVGAWRGSGWSPPPLLLREGPGLKDAGLGEEPSDLGWAEGTSLVRRRRIAGRDERKTPSPSLTRGTSPVPPATDLRQQGRRRGGFLTLYRWFLGAASDWSASWNALRKVSQSALVCSVLR